ncbi:SemiSWEET family transporter [Escherichia coli]|uniref:SemiSWEET family transporter n=2 Tax=Escherichia coli TaxID=562 RepID=UPI00207C0BE7|nr:SemiSWEET family transporter [Escherichia coli]
MICSPMTSLKTSIKTITYLSDTGCLEIQGASLEGISVVMYIMFLTGVISWIAYGIMRSDFAVLIANIVTLFLAAPVLVITLINRRKKHV